MLASKTSHFERVCSFPRRLNVYPVVSLVRVEAVVGGFLPFCPSRRWLWVACTPKELCDRAGRLAYSSAHRHPPGPLPVIRLARLSRALCTPLIIPLASLRRKESLRKESLMVSGFRFPPLTSPSPAVLAFGRPRGGAWLIAHCPRPVPPWCVRPSRLARSYEIELWEGR